MKDLVKRFEFYIRSTARLGDDVARSINDLEEGEHSRYMHDRFKYVVEELISLHQKEPDKLYDILLIMHEKGRLSALREISEGLYNIEHHEDEEI